MVTLTGTTTTSKDYSSVHTLKNSTIGLDHKERLKPPFWRYPANDELDSTTNTPARIVRRILDLALLATRSYIVYFPQIFFCM
jgi:hypothetical protein